MAKDFFRQYSKARGYFCLALLVTILLPAGLLLTRGSSAATVISFEGLAAPVVLDNQFAGNGIRFNSVFVLDYSQVPIPNFAHSGTKAIELCHAAEFCIDKLEVRFTAPQKRVKLWVGYARPLSDVQAVIMRAFDGGGHEVTADIKLLQPSSTVIPITTPLEVNFPTANIARVTVGIAGAESNPPRAFNAGLAFDDLEFDTQVTSQCPATVPPQLTINTPLPDRIIFQNTFTVTAKVTTLDPFPTLQVGIAGPLPGQNRNFGPVPAGPGLFVTLPGLLFPGKNTLTFTARDCRGAVRVVQTLFFRPDVTRTNISVIDESGLPVPGAQVYARGVLLGNTDQFGTFTAPPLLSGTKLIARRLVRESRTRRSHHSVGSSQNWKYRVYTSNLAVKNDGSVEQFSVKIEPDPLARQVVRVLRRNAQIGVHLLASIEWDASVAERLTFEQLLIDMSRHLYNATDGQILIEQAEIVDNKRFWDDADVRIYANLSLRAFVDTPPGAFLNEFQLPFAHSRIHVRRKNLSGVYAHEFGHYGLGVWDEYKDEDPSVHCTAALVKNSAEDPFDVGSPQASCLMSTGGGAKLCSSVAENPHVKGTDQGDESCWSTLSRLYRDTRDTPRWILLTPDTRGQIPGAINGGILPVRSWNTKVTTDNGSHANLCQPISFFPTLPDGTPDIGAKVWLSTTYGAHILEGKVNRFGTIIATGLHVGDRVGDYTIKSSDCSQTSRVLPPSPSSNKPDWLTTLSHHVTSMTGGEDPYQRVIRIVRPFNVYTSVKPSGSGRSVEVMVRAEDAQGQPIKLGGVPSVALRLGGEEKSRNVRMRFSPKLNGYLGTLYTLPEQLEFEIEVKATDQKGQTLNAFSQLRMTRIDVRSETDVFAADGQIDLRVPARALPAGAIVSMGPVAFALPPIPGGFALVGEPVSIQSFPDARLTKPGSLRIHFSDDPENLEMFDLNSFKILRYNQGTHSWDDLGGVVHRSSLALVTITTEQLGTFALIGKRAARGGVALVNERQIDSTTLTKRSGSHTAGG